MPRSGMHHPLQNRPERYGIDIFKGNALNNGLLPVVISPDLLSRVFQVIDENPKAEFKVDLENQEFTILSTGESESFEINDYKKHCLLFGLDVIDYLVSLKSEIENYEKR